jgi:hypothetical protein
MSDDYEIVDASTIEFASRSRKPKYAHKHWESTNPRDMHIYYSALQRNHIRRNGCNETPYDHLIDQKMKREEEYQRIFPISLEAVMSDPSNLIDPSSIGREVFPWRK